MSIQDLCQAYLAALNKADLSKVLSLFAEGATVTSPLYGVCPAVDFYQNLFADTDRSETRLKAVFEEVGLGQSVALQFEYDWVLKSGQLVRFECVDVFELTQDKERFAGLKIIYDTAPLRADFDESRRG
ncbi:hypothetical protein AA106555_1428 [Neokomagataea thailandica NBRC 106555]|uniref:Nuclear transport factor 2 family protein n=2 Tax=Neokomagataea TaxID=1223423 RepID=A0A4Y6V444_9PROT|nr:MULTISPECIES: nuclear transport factor 2 family protein [Neokomagataea]QDH24713.1 nuclear transport factor 2 family protein [Neokomagataea tanensis]GBR53766.1 hypothetical protein AA106555_1428 [Neokomagataea thailandica NBRC 106555]